MKEANWEHLFLMKLKRRVWFLIHQIETFTDLGDDSDIMLCFSDSVEKDNKSSPKLSSTKEKLATHILQFFYKSLFTNFDFPCAYFVTRGITAVLLCSY